VAERLVGQDSTVGRGGGGLSARATLVLSGLSVVHDQCAVHPWY